MKLITSVLVFALAWLVFTATNQPAAGDTAVPLAAYATALPPAPLGAGWETAVNQAAPSPTSTGAPPVWVSSPAIGLDTAVTPAALDSTPASGVGWWNESGAPGAPGNVVLFGHNYSSFAALERAQIGDQISVETSSGAFRYVIAERHILPEEGQSQATREANGRWVLPFGDERLTLVTCWPFPNGTSHRLVIVAKGVTS